MIVVITAEAEADLEEIAAYIAEQSPDISLSASYDRDVSHCWMRRVATPWSHGMSISEFAGVPSAGI